MLMPLFVLIIQCESYHREDIGSCELVALDGTVEDGAHVNLRLLLADGTLKDGGRHLLRCLWMGSGCVFVCVLELVCVCLYACVCMFAALSPFLSKSAHVITTRQLFCVSIKPTWTMPAAFCIVVFIVSRALSP